MSHPCVCCVCVYVSLNVHGDGDCGDEYQGLTLACMCISLCFHRVGPRFDYERAGTAAQAQGEEIWANNSGHLRPTRVATSSLLLLSF